MAAVHGAGGNRGDDDGASGRGGIAEDVRQETRFAPSSQRTGPAAPPMLINVCATRCDLNHGRADGHAP